MTRHWLFGAELTLGLALALALPAYSQDIVPAYTAPGTSGAAASRGASAAGVNGTGGTGGQDSIVPPESSGNEGNVGRYRGAGESRLVAGAAQGSAPASQAVVPSLYGAGGGRSAATNGTAGGGTGGAWGWLGLVGLIGLAGLRTSRPSP